jgi:hypothetical protein
VKKLFALFVMAGLMAASIGCGDSTPAKKDTKGATPAPAAGKAPEAGKGPATPAAPPADKK